MKLKNKKTGKIHEITEVVPLHNMDKKFVIYSKTEGHNYAYKNLAELNEEWCDYEEPKDFWYIDDFALMCGTEGEFTSPDLASFTKKDIGKLKQIGNYFSSREEAEKAVERLRAWKRLRDKGFRFGGRLKPNYGEKFIIECSLPKETLVIDVAEDLDLLFCTGGEE